MHDHDEALELYAKAPGWAVLADVKVEPWYFRWLAAGPVGQDDAGLALMPVPGPPMISPPGVYEPKTARMNRSACRVARSRAAWISSGCAPLCSHSTRASATGAISA